MAKKLYFSISREDFYSSTVKLGGKVMGKINPMLKGKADMSLVSKLIKERLS